ncbi:RES domain protein [Pseudomonas amygdali pv. tabaci]|uniref:RES domain protein n=1 Tax=Pseudomonas amygdali pv. tabaci TaxID=322 RepID=A0A3M6HYE7_PSEAJ|nr:RES domain protein [Pseudomonas amygdali pv. tabaci]
MFMMWTQRHVCLGCIEDGYLRAQLESLPNLNFAACFYCGSQRAGITLDDLALRCGVAIDGSFRELDPTMGSGDAGLPTYTMAAVIRAVFTGRPELRSDIEATLYMAWETDDSYNPLFVLGPELDPKGVYQLALRDAGAHPGRLYDDLVSLIMDSQIREEDCFFQQTGPGCLIQRVYTARAFPTIEAVENALAEPDTSMLPEQNKSSELDLGNLAPMLCASTEVGLAMADARPWMGSYVVTAEVDIQQPITLLDLRQASLMPLQVEESYFSPKQAQRGQQAAFFRKVQQALNAERHVQDLDRSPGSGFQTMSRLAACLRSTRQNVCGLLLSPASTLAQWWEEPGCSVLLWDGLNLQDESTDDRHDKVGDRTGSGSIRTDRHIRTNAGCSGWGFLYVRRDGLSVHHIGGVDVRSTELTSEHYALRESHGH